MKKINIFVFLLLIYSGIVHGQYQYEEYISGTTAEMLNPPGKVISANAYSANGDSFTPKGDLRVLIICAGFGPEYDYQHVNGWPSHPDSLPRALVNNVYFYNDPSQFTMNPAADAMNNVSAYYYAMSRGQFRLMADVYPKRINIDTHSISNASWTQTTTEVLNQMKREDPNFDWSPYDNRTNMPGYNFDNRNTASDMMPDYVIVVYRYYNNFQNMPNIPTRNRGATGWASIDISSTFNYNGYTFDSGCGFTQLNGGYNISTVFIHEVAHTLFNAPHIGGTNNIMGKYFYIEHAWSQMDKDIRIFNCSNAWERWYLDWIDGIKASNVPAAIDSEADLNATGEYTLRDFITTGDAIRIKIPNGTGRNQYVWLENHQGKSIYDNTANTTDGCGNPFPSPTRGVLCYYESINDNKNNPGYSVTFDHKEAANGIKVINATGNYDYSYSSYNTECFWGNPVYNFHREAINPIAGQSGTQRIKNDYNNTNTILIDDHVNSVPSTVVLPYNVYPVKRDNMIIHEYMSPDQAFKAGMKLSMSSNPCLVNRPIFNQMTNTMGTYFLNGISISILSYDSQGNARVKIRFKDVDITQDTRYTGTIHLLDITANGNPDIRINPYCTLKIDKSGTPNRMTKTSRGEFINLTEFKCLANSHFMLDENSKAIVHNLSTFVVESGATLTINDGASFIVRRGSTLILKNGSNVKINGTGRIRIEQDAYICIEPSCNIRLDELASVIYIDEFAQLGCGPDATTQGTPCVSNINNISFSGGGSVVDGSQDIYIYNTVLNTDRYFGGRYIYVSKTPPDINPPIRETEVVVTNNANVIFEGKEVILNRRFRCDKGSTYIIR